MSGSGLVTGAPNLSVIDAVTQFVGGTQAVWNTVSIPIPAGLVVYAVDTTALKIGDGTSLYVNLPVVLTLNSIPTLMSDVATLLGGGGGTGGGVTQIELTAALGSYTTTTALNALLAGYVTTSALSTALGGVLTTASLSNYVTATSLAAALNNYITGSQLTADLANYTTTTALEAALTNYVTTNSLATTLSGYRTRLTANTTFYISNTLGNDTTGVGTLAAPWATFPRAYAMLSNKYDLAGYNITLNYNGSTFVSANNMSGALWYKFDAATPPAADIFLYVGDKVSITFTGVTALPLRVSTVPGLYKATLMVTANNTTNSDWVLQPNNVTHGSAFQTWSIETIDGSLTGFGSATTSPSWVATTLYPNIYANSIPSENATGFTNAFLIDVMNGPSLADATNDIGPSLQEFIISTYTAAKMLKQSSAIRGGPAINSSMWFDTTTSWTSLGTIWDDGGNVGGTVNATISGTMIIERIA